MTKTFHRLTLISLALAASMQLAACGGGSAGAPDIFPPTVVITSQAADSGDVVFTFTFNEDVGDSFTASDIQITGGSLVSLTRVSPTVYSAVVKPDSASTPLLVNVAAESFADEAGNLNLSNPSAVFDPTAPSLTITDNVSAATAAGDVVFTFTFNKAVSGFTVDDVTVAPEGAQKADFVMAADNKSATLRVTPPANSTGTLEVSVAPGTFTDFSDNANVATFTGSQAFDTTGETPPSNNLLANGDFEDGGTGWIGNALNVQTEGGNSFNFADVQAAGQPFDVNLSYPVNIPTEGVKYKLSFKASSNTNRVLRAGIGLNQDPWTNVSEDVNLTTTPQTFTLELTSNFANANSRVLFDMGQAVGHVVIDDVVLEQIPVAPLVANGSFDSGTTGWTGNAANVVTEGGNSFNLAQVAAAGNPWDVNLSYPLSIPTEGVQYKLTFKASSNRARALKAGIGLNGDPWTNTVQDLTLSTTLQTYEVILTSNFASDNSRVIFDMGHDTGDVVIDDVVLELVEGGGAGTTEPGVFSSGFASNVLTASGGAIVSAGGSNLDGWGCNGTPEWCGSGAGGSGNDSSMYFYYQTPSPAEGLYSQIEVFGPGVSGFSTTGDTAGVNVAGKSTLNFNFNPNPEWYNSPVKNLGVVLTLGKRYAIDGGCRLQLHGVKAIASPDNIAYSMNLLNDFRVAADCGAGIAPNDVAAALAASPVVSSVKFLGADGGAAIIGRSGVKSSANLSVAAGTVYPTTVALKGAITFN